jgi:hypothetical protein
MASTVNRILWWSLVISLLVYVVVAHVASVPHNAQIPLGMLFAVFAVVSVGTAAGTLIYRRHALAGPIKRGELDPSSREGQQKAFQPFILNLLLSESVGIYGLVLALLSGEGAYSVPFVLVALALLYLHRPTAPDLVPLMSSEHYSTGPPPIA